ncbi:MAG TPA: FimV/HubP family polar landmark protein [Kiritimatiellia bacterium]
MAALVLACTALVSVPLLAQIAPTHEVRRGDTLFAVVRKTKYDGVSRNQMILAIWRANQGVFPGGNINLLEVGTVLAIPPRETVAAIDPAEADRSVRDLLAKAAAGPLAAVKPASVAASAKPAATTPASREEAARRYREGQALERKGDDHGALKAYLEAGEAGNGLAQRRLGQIYDKGNSAVQRDYQASLKWYQKAREQGVEIDKPLPRMTTK